MNTATWMTLSHSAIALGVVLSALGGFGQYYFGRRLDQEKEAAGAQAESVVVVQRLDREIAARLRVFREALGEEDSRNWPGPRTYANILWFPDNASDLYPEYREYRLKALLVLLADQVPPAERPDIELALSAVADLESHRATMKVKDPNQTQNPPPEYANMRTTILPRLFRPRWK